MKKIIITAVIVIMCAGAANAQWYAGGSIGYRSRAHKVASDMSSQEDKLTGFSFSPRVGYAFDKMLVGVEFSVMLNKRLSNDVLTGPNVTELGFGVRPYYRYNFVKLGNFNIGAEVGVSIGSSTVEGSNAPSTKSMAFGFDIAPVVTFAINKHLWIETKLDIFGLDYQYTRSHIVNDEGNYTSNSVFTGIIDGDSLLTLGNIKLGLVYRF